METKHKVFFKSGEFIGDYQVLTMLGYGKTGATYHVINNVFNKEFALKVLAIPEELSLEWLNRLEAQSATLAQVSSSIIDKPIGSGRLHNLWFSVKDFVHNGEGRALNLKQYLNLHKEKLSEFQIYHIFRQLLKGLMQASHFQDANHEGLAHGNLKLENILLSHTLPLPGQQNLLPVEIRLTDFQPYGLFDDAHLCEFVEFWEQERRQTSEPLINEVIKQLLSSIYTSYDYMSPEDTLGSIPTVEKDIFALGVITYRMLTGMHPEGYFDLPTKLDATLNPFWDEFIQQSLEPQSKYRYHNYASLLENLEKAFETFTELSAQAETQVIYEDKEGEKERLSLTPKHMVYIPAGVYSIGSQECGEDAQPVHNYESKGFYMDKACVTVAQFRRFIKETGYVTFAQRGEGAPIWVEGQWKILEGISWVNPTGNVLPKDFESHPVTQVTLEDAKAYCEWAGKRLPNEKEWELAARGGQQGTLYPWGNTITKAQANFLSDRTKAVMQYPANAYGLYDMVGNVWEWTQSSYQAYPGAQNENPHFNKGYQVVRGGAWLYDAAYCMLAFRNANQPQHCYPTVGFRAVMDFTTDD